MTITKKSHNHKFVNTSQYNNEEPRSGVSMIDRKGNTCYWTEFGMLRFGNISAIREVQ